MTQEDVDEAYAAGEAAGEAEAEAEAEAEDEVDFAHLYLRCSNCNAALVDLLLTVPEADVVTKLRATCCWCGDESFEAEVHGGFHVGGTGAPDPEDPTNQFESTLIVSHEEKDDYILFQVARASTDARPFYVH